MPRTLRIARLMVLLWVFWSLVPSVSAADVSNKEIVIQRGTGILRIDFVGNTAFTARELGKYIDADRPDIWFDKSGILNLHVLDAEATDKLTAFYYDHGFLNIQVNAGPIGHDNRVTIRIDEGPLYRVGSIAIEGPGFRRSELEATIREKSGQAFRGSTLQRDVVALSDFYSDRGYGYVNVDPRTQLDSQRHLVNIRVYIKPGPKTRIGRIKVSGASAYDERMIRDVLSFHEHELYSAKALRESQAWLNGLPILRDVEIRSKASTEHEIDVEIIVREGDCGIALCDPCFVLSVGCDW